MKILIMSDLHLETGDMNVPEGDHDVLILAGDVCNSGRHSIYWAQQERVNHGKPTIFVPGNHEYYEESMPYTLSAMKAAAAGSLVHLLNRDTVIINGIRFIGCTLWTDFKLPVGPLNKLQTDQAKAMNKAFQYMLDYQQIMTTESDFKFLTPQETMDFHTLQRDWLKATLDEPFDGPTVVITHHAPHRNSLAERYQADWCSPAFVSELPLDFFDVPVLWVHGHTHTFFDYYARNCRVVCNPRGYGTDAFGCTEYTNFNPRFTVEI